MTRNIKAIVRFDKVPSRVGVRTLRRPPVPKPHLVAASNSDRMMESDDQSPTGETGSDEPLVSQHLVNLLDALTAQISELKESHENRTPGLREAVVELSCMIANHLVGREIKTQPLDLTSVVSAAVDRLLPANHITVKVNPQDVVELTTYGDQLDGSFLQVVQDERMSRGECQVISDDHTLSSNLEMRLKNIRETLLGGLDDAGLEQTTGTRPARS